MEQEAMGHSQADAEGPADQGQEDPLQMLGQGLEQVVAGISKSSAPDEAKQAFAASLDAFKQGVAALSGGGASGPQPMSGSEQMGGGNPNAQPVR